MAFGWHHASMAFGATIYARRGDSHLAYRVAEGEGPAVVALMPGYLPMSSLGDPFGRPFFDRLAGLGRVVLAERLGVGESDPIDPHHPPTLDDVVDDLLAVMDHADLHKATLFGFYNAGAVSIRAAARRPDRVERIAAIQSFVSWGDTPDVEGVAEHYRRIWAAEVERGPSDEIDMLSVVAPSAADNPEFRAWWAEVGRRGASPRSALAMGAADAMWDVRQDLGKVSAPTLVVHRRGNRFVPISHARYAAERINGARLIEVAGIDHLGVVGDVDALLDPVEEFITERAPRRQRVLAAVLFTDLVDSTTRALDEGDRRWSRLVVEHDQIVGEVVLANDGEVIKSTGDGVLAVFVSPAAAIRAAQRIQARMEGRELAVRAGIHAGEIERLPGDVTGIAVNIAARVMSHAGPGELLVSSAVPPLVTGSGLSFVERAEVELKGVPGTWTLLSPSVG